jgi:hypothetical protein
MPCQQPKGYKAGQKTAEPCKAVRIKETLYWMSEQLRRRLEDMVEFCANNSAQSQYQNDSLRKTVSKTMASEVNFKNFPG